MTRFSKSTPGCVLCGTHSGHDHSARGELVKGAPVSERVLTRALCEHGRTPSVQTLGHSEGQNAAFNQGGTNAFFAFFLIFPDFCQNLHFLCVFFACFVFFFLAIFF